MSLNELADILDVSRQQVSAWENGVKTISQKRLRQLSEYFGVDEKFFLDISEDDKEFIVSRWQMTSSIDRFRILILRNP